MNQQSRARRLPGLAAYAIAVLIVAAGYASYTQMFSPVGRWQAYDNDPADYRFVAEYFWHVPFEPATYDPIWQGGWGDYLRTVPFRGIGLGTMYLAAGWVRLGHAPHTQDDVNAAGVALASAEKAIYAVALLLLFAAVRRRWGTGLALFTIAVTALYREEWRITDDFITEPALRIVFVLALAVAVTMTERRSIVRGAFALAALWIVAAHVKVQWWVAALALLPVLLFQFWRVRASVVSAVALCVATAAVPASVLAVNWIGWRSTSLSPGIGLHINLKYDRNVLRQYAAVNLHNPQRPAFAHPGEPQLRWWYIDVGEGATRQQYDEFDRYARRYVQLRPATAVRSFWEGLTLASTVPGHDEWPHGLLRFNPLPEPWRVAVRALDVVVWVLLAAGLAFDRTRVGCALGLVLWVVPALGHVFSPYELRYHLPMAGLGACAAAFVVARIAGNRYN